MEKIWIGILGVIVVGALRVGYLMYRSSRVRKVASRLGSFAPHSELWMREISKYSLTRRGKSKRCLDCIEGEYKGVSFRLFEYWFRAYTGDSYAPYSQTVALLRPDGVFLPKFHVKKRSLVSKMTGDAFDAVHTISVSPAFDSKFTVTTMDPIETQALFSAEVIEFLLTRRVVPLSNSMFSSEFEIETNRDEFLVYSPDKTVKPELLEDFLDNCVQLLRLFEDAIARGDCEAAVAIQPASQGLAPTR